MVNIYNACPVLRGRHYTLLAYSLVFFCFSLFYNQDLRSATIEPLYEKLPDHLEEVDIQTQNLFTIGLVPFFDSISIWNLFVLDTLSVDLNDFYCIHDTTACTMPFIALWRMAKSPNYFTMISKHMYYTSLVKIRNVISQSHFSPLRYDDGTFAWQWRLSAKVSRQRMETIIVFKHR